MTLFDCLKDVITVKSGKLAEQADFKKTWSSFMMVRYLSMDSRFQEVAFEANRMTELLSAEQMYRYLVKAVPKSSNSFIRYIAKAKAAKKGAKDSADVGA